MRNVLTSISIIIMNMLKEQESVQILMQCNVIVIYLVCNIVGIFFQKLRTLRALTLWLYAFTI